MFGIVRPSWRYSKDPSGLTFFADVLVGASRMMSTIWLCRSFRNFKSLRRDVEDLEQVAHRDDATRSCRCWKDPLASEEDRHGARQGSKGSEGATRVLWIKDLELPNCYEYMCACMCVCARILFVIHTVVGK